MMNITPQLFGIANVTPTTFDVVDQPAYLSLVNYHFGLHQHIIVSTQGDMNALRFHSEAAYQLFLTFADKADVVEAEAVEAEAAPDVVDEKYAEALESAMVNADTNPLPDVDDEPVETLDDNSEG